MQQAIDNVLLRRFQVEIKSKVPHAVEGALGSQLVNSTPLSDITRPLLECARAEYGLEMEARDVKVYGKFDSQILGGSVKVRPAVQIVEDAISSGRLRGGQTIFEATSGNFGLALGMFRRLGLEVVVLVSRKLQEGVFDQLKKDGVKVANLDIDICPAPGLNVDTNTLVAKVQADSLREQLAGLGMDLSVFDASRKEIEKLLLRQDMINLAKCLAQAYDGFCPQQYDNELNVKVHETVTAPEIDQQLTALGESVSDYKVLCTFGTGGTSTGISRYVQSKYGKKSLHVVFPLANQEVAGIRTKEKALGLRFYRPKEYAGVHEVDFEAAKPVLRFFASNGYDIGESTALALYACLQMLNYGVGEKFVVIVADGIEKYRRGIETKSERTRRLETTFEEAKANLTDYEKVLWTHAMYVPREEGVRMIASSLGCDEGMVEISRARDVQTLISTGELSETMKRLMPRDNRKLLLVCMVGGTSLTIADILARKGIDAESITGGIMTVAEATHKDPSDVVQVAME